MSAQLPCALRTRFQKLIEEGLSGRAAALRLKLSASTGTRWARSVRTRRRLHLAYPGHCAGEIDKGFV